jgi:hypothetical protein
MLTFNSAIRGLNSRRNNLDARMRRVFLGITIYLIWEERNKRIFEDKSLGIDAVFRRLKGTVSS